MLRKKLNDTKKAFDALKAKDAEFVSREAELEKSIEEAATDEERSAVEEAIEGYETNKAEHEEKKAGLERQIEDLENEIAEEEANQNTDPAPAPEPEERKDNKIMNIRDKFFRGMDIQTRNEMFEREDVKAWLSAIRTCISEKRALDNVGLTIPEVFLGLLRQNIENYSKLYKLVTVKQISGTGRMVVMGGISEAIWTECCATLNVMSIGFNDVEIDCYKVGGFFKVCNATLEDSNVDLAGEILTAIGQGIGYALDKAILYGKNSSAANKMPEGIVTRLAQTETPADYPSTARTWVDLHSTNILTIASTVTGASLFQTILLDSGVISDKYSKDGLVWAMNKTTKNYLTAQAMSVNANGAIVSGFENTMPVIGGQIEVLDFIPNYVIIAGHFDDYLLAERAGKKFAQSEHAFFLQDQTAFKGTARYDGKPVIAEAFAVIGVNDAVPAAGSVSFAANNANTPDAVMLSQSSGSVVKNHTLALKATVFANGVPTDAVITWASSDTSKATVSGGTVTGVAAGNAVITATAGSAVGICNITVTST
jgi:HK97 family phage major capsid protein